VRQPLPAAFDHATGLRHSGIGLVPVLTLAIFLFLPTTARAQTAQNVLLVINENSADSIKIGEHYARTRSVPAGQVVRIKAPVAEAVSRPAYQASIEAPIAGWLSRYLLQDQILFIVLTKGIPLRVDGTSGQAGTVASVDSELTLLYRKMTGVPISAAGHIDNPYYLNERPLSEARRFTPRTLDIDILFYGDAIISAPDDLHIPHLLAAERAFVLRPLADIAPEYTHPTLYRRVSELLDDLADDHEVRRGAYPAHWFEG